MTRALAAIMLLFAQLFSVFSAGNLVLCIHPDGRSETEWIGSECCRAAHAAEQVPAPSDDPSVGPSFRAVGDQCRDVPVKQAPALVAKASHVRADVCSEAQNAPPAIVVVAALALVAEERAETPNARSPPRGPVPRRALPFVLRC